MSDYIRLTIPKNRKKMRILLSAYACEPNKGSEPAVGWNWALQLSKFFEVTVLTRLNNKEVIENELEINPQTNIQFIYYDIPVLSKIKKIFPFGTQIYFLIWERLACKSISHLHFDIKQRLTFVSLVTIANWGELTGAYFLGLLAGGELAPKCFYEHYNYFNKIREVLRKTYNSMYKYSKVVKSNYENAYACICVNEETSRYVKEMGYNGKIYILPAIGVEESLISNNKPIERETFKIVYGGNLYYFKNIDILIKVFKQVNIPNCEFNIYGKGPEYKKLTKLAEDLNIADKIRFVNELNRKEYLNEIKTSHLFVFASSHDSGGFAVLEALALNIPVLILGNGGPKEIFNGIEYPLIINPNKTIDEIVYEFKNKIEWLNENYEIFINKYQGIRTQILNRYKWDNKAVQLIDIYKERLGENIIDS